MILRNPNMYPPTKFRIPASNNIQICPGLDIYGTEARGQCHSDPETVADTQWPKYASTYLIWEFYVIQYRNMLYTRYLYN